MPHTPFSPPHAHLREEERCKLLEKTKSLTKPRSLRIKRAVDPDDVFWCTPCVGNERWRQVGDRLCRV